MECINRLGKCHLAWSERISQESKQHRKKNERVRHYYLVVI